MQTIDYTRSFLHGTKPYNRVRFVVEARTRLIDDADGSISDFVVCASCKSEDTYAEKNLFYEDNYDFLPVFGPTHNVIFRSKAYLDDPYRAVYPQDSPFGSVTHRLQSPRSITELHANSAIRDATHQGLILIAQTEWHNPDTQLRAVLEYPVKTMNINDENDWYQVDTGPVACPDLAHRPERLVDTLSLAYVAFNRPEFAEFVIEAPTPIVGDGREITRVPHYSLRRRVNGRNRLFSLH